MAFTHGKKGRLWIDGLELTSYFNDFTMAAKAGIAETTVYGLGAKTFIGGLREGQIMAKGYFGASAADPEDPTLSRALGRQENMSVLFSPSGDVALGDRVVVAYAAETDMEITTPVTGVVATAMTAQADSGLSTGVWLAAPGTSLTGAGFPTYTGSSVLPSSVATDTKGLVAVLQITHLSYTGGTGLGVYITVQHSTDNSTWTTLGYWGPYQGQTMTYPEPGPSGDPAFIAVVAPGSLVTGSTFVVSVGYPTGPYYRIYVDTNDDITSSLNLVFCAALSGI